MPIGLPVAVLLHSGDNATLPLTYAEGRAATAADEIALSLVALARADQAVGGVIELTVAETSHTLRIVGAYQDITGGGSTARALLPVDAAEALGYSFAVDLTDGADSSSTRQRLAAAAPDARVADVEDYRAQTLGPVTGRMASTAGVAAAVAIALAVLVSVLTTRMLLAGDAGQIAIQRALGTPDTSIRSQYATSMLTCLAIGVPLGAVAAATAGQALFNVLFEGLYGGLQLLGQGTSRIDFVADPLVTGLGLPLVLAAAVIAATVASCGDLKTLGIRKVVAE